MKPAARLQAAIELLGEVEAGNLPVDRLAANFFRARRYAGSKDRTDITERVYSILRRKGELAWLIGQGKGEALPRNLLLASLAAFDRLPLEDIDGLFSGDGYGPAALDVEERALVGALVACLPDEMTARMPDWARGNYPEWLDGELRRRFGDLLLAEMAALAGRAPLDLRVNSLKMGRAKALARLREEGIEAQECPLSPLGIRLQGRARITGHDLFKSGVVEVQDEGAQLAALLTDARAGMQVVDYCAGAGGKTLALSAAMKNKGQLFAFDTDRRRMNDLWPRLQRAGARNVQSALLGAEEGTARLESLKGKADRVLVDAPCSGTGTWRRNPGQKWRLDRAALENYQALQVKVLDGAAPLVAVGGRLVYVTCSLLPSENEEQVTAFLARHPGFSRLPIAPVWSEVIGGDCPESGDGVALTPDSHGTDGFFIALLECRA